MDTYFFYFFILSLSLSLAALSLLISSSISRITQGDRASAYRGALAPVRALDSGSTRSTCSCTRSTASAARLLPTTASSVHAGGAASASAHPAPPPAVGVGPRAGLRSGSRRRASNNGGDRPRTRGSVRRAGRAGHGSSGLWSSTGEEGYRGESFRLPGKRVSRRFCRNRPGRCGGASVGIGGRQNRELSDPFGWDFRFFSAHNRIKSGNKHAPSTFPNIVKTGAATSRLPPPTFSPK
jgi:hypothetical protein